MLDHRVLTMVGPAIEGIAPGGLPYGAMTGLTYQRLPWLIRRQHALPYAAALIRDHETRYFVALRLALGHRGLVDRHAERQHAAEARRGRGAPGR